MLPDKDRERKPEKRVCPHLCVCIFIYFFAMELIYHLDEEIKSGLSRRCSLGDIQRMQVDISFSNGCNSVLNSLLLRVCRTVVD